MKNKLVKRIISVILVVILVMSTAACGSEKVNEFVGDIPVVGGLVRDKLNLEDYINVTFDGYNGAGRAVIGFNTVAVSTLVDAEKINQLFKKTIEYGMLPDEYINKMVSYCELSDLIGFELTTEGTNLSNGDMFSVKVVVDQIFADSGVTLEELKSILGVDFDEEFTYTVTGLKDGIAIDVLTGIEQYITYIGANGGGQASFSLPDNYYKEVNGFYVSKKDFGGISIVYNNEEIGTVSIYQENPFAQNLKKGDQIRFYIQSNSQASLAEKYNIFFAPSEIYVIVPDLGDYVTSASQLSDKQIGEMKQAILDDYDEPSWRKLIPLTDVYAGTLKPQNVNEHKSPFAMFYVMREDSYDIFGEKESDDYQLFAIYDIAINPDGKLIYSATSSWNCESFDTMEELENYVSNNSGDYNFSKVK